MNTELFEPRQFEAEGMTLIGGEKISYRTISEDNVIYLDGKPAASLFSYSYFRTDVSNVEDRPVIFAFNGGPGTSCMMVHIGFLGIRRVRYGEPNEPSTLPPYALTVNDECLLDQADLVLIDPVGTGYGLLLDEEKKSRFYGIEEDGETLLLFIEKWLTKYKRWGSPKYLLGESYGCTRIAAAVGIASGSGATRDYGFAFDGVVLIGNSVSVGQYFNREVPAEPTILGFPTYAAIHWYYHRPEAISLEEFVAQARGFAESEYLMALYAGDSLSPEAKRQIIQKVTAYTGVSKRYLLDHDMRIDDSSFRSEVLREEGLAVARCDARVTRSLHEPFVFEENRGYRDDAVLIKYTPYFLSAYMKYMEDVLGIRDFERSFMPSAHLYWDWNKETKEFTTGQHLAHAMLRIPGMRAFFANGYYDIATLIGIAYYTINHAHLPKDRTSIKGYASGHMVYLGEDNIRELTADIRAFLRGKMV